MKPRARKVSLAIALVGLFLGVGQGCRTATQMTLVVTFNGNCSDLNGVGFIVGTDPAGTESRIETNLFTTTTSQCETGSPAQIGTLVVTPSDATSRATVIVLAAIGQRVDECKPETGYAGCIIARRAFSFVDHTALTLDIPLELECKNVPCDAVSTCEHASCVSSSTECSESGCKKTGILGDGAVDFVDAPTSSDAFIQGDHVAPTDAPVLIDAPADAPVDSGVDAASCVGSNQPVSCTTSGGPKVCTPTNNTCCYGVSAGLDAGGGDGGPGDGGGAAGYDCRPSGACTFTPPNYPVRCRSSANCAEGQVCCVGTTLVGGAFCSVGKSCSGGFDAGTGQQACTDNCECPKSQTCSGSLVIGTGGPSQTLTICQ